ncbi:hypothetical protein DEA8626_01269 [Defluviimonas aquaemixtae]|uniref:TPM domain-containing protein n=1 Tax=Albidovulum aquaemixtae TaxID=1542388 RepID=A0A2R8B5B2_9RHOB|nr:hypothetical protein DEA8626_01269 [Defluviimonas aquaemixtae]
MTRFAMIRAIGTIRLGFLMAFFWLAAPMTAQAKPYPEPRDLYVNDFAGVIAGDTETRLAATLAALFDETGVEMTVVTLRSRAEFDDAPSTEGFATELFNAWGVGDAGRNDGILVLLLTDDRETRIVLGSAYHQGFDVAAQDIVSRWMVPAFREGRHGEGITAGVAETAERIARRHAASLPPAAVPEAERGFADRFGGWIFAAVFSAIVALGLFERRLRDAFYRLRRCPQCGARGLHRHRDAPENKGTREGRIGRLTVTCDNCDYRDEREYRVSPRRRTGGSRGSFGGGRSSGGGASGRW